MKKRKYLNLSIKHLNRGIYLVLIDGDKFYSDSYEHAVLLAIEVIMRDELSHGQHLSIFQTDHYLADPLEVVTVNPNFDNLGL